jgi:molecular chaperone DnaK
VAGVSDDWVLSIDFGTTYTTVAVRVEAQPPEIIEIDGDRRVPSVVLADEISGCLLVGRRADDLAHSQPRGAARELKRRLGEGTPVLLGGVAYSLPEVVGALLAYVAAAAETYVGSPPSRVVLTHPATWRRIRTDALIRAAASAGLGHPLLLSEPVAAAMSYAQAGNLPEGPMAIYDLGGGTFDTAVVATDGVFRILGAAQGSGRIGGELFDELVIDHVGRQLPTELWENLQGSEEAVWRQAWARNRGEARRAKEALSLHERAYVMMGHPDGQTPVLLTRDEFESVIESHLLETVDILETTLVDAQVAPEDLGAIYLVGGASRMPVVQRMLADAFPGAPLLRRGDPKMAVALGAAWAAGSALLDGSPEEGGPTVTVPAPGETEPPEQARQSMLLVTLYDYVSRQARRVRRQAVFFMVIGATFFFLAIAVLLRLPE